MSHFVGKFPPHCKHFRDMPPRPGPIPPPAGARHPCSVDDKEMSTMKWIPLLAAPLLCALALQAHAENFSKCRDEGGVVAYRSHACLAGETLVATLDPEPETRAPQREGESARRSEEHTSELQSLMRISYAVFCLKKKKKTNEKKESMYEYR